MDGFTPLKGQAVQSVYGVKADLVCWMLEFRQGPKCFTADLPGRKSVDVIPNGVVCHGSLHNIDILQ